MNYVICAHDKARYFWDVWRKPSVGTWYEVRDTEALTVEHLMTIKPEAVFFTHWSVKVPPEIHLRWPCYNLHAAPLPAYAGCNPIQTQILDGKKETAVTMHEMTEQFDAGRIVMQRPLSLLGGGDEVYRRHGKLMTDMVRDYVAHPEEYPPREQEGERTWSHRRTPEQSNLDLEENWERGSQIGPLFEMMRALDVEGYPHIYFDRRGLRYTFTHPVLRRDGIEAHVKIERIEDADSR